MPFDTGKPDELRDMLWERIQAKYAEKEKIVPAEMLRRVERDLMLQIVDSQWKDHLYSLDHLKEGIGLRGYGQRDPLVEYKKESFQLFQDMRRRIEEEIVRYLWWLRPVEGRAPTPPSRRPGRRRDRPPPLTYNAPSDSAIARRSAAAVAGGSPPGGVRLPRRRPRRRARRASAATTRRSRPSSATSRRSAATIRAGVAAGRNTRSATGPTDGASDVPSASRQSSEGRPVRRPIVSSRFASDRP